MGQLEVHQQGLVLSAHFLCNVSHGIFCSLEFG
jgi:hypothetical protein